MMWAMLLDDLTNGGAADNILGLSHSHRQGASTVRVGVVANVDRVVR
jgi:hypothetical protein